VKKGLLLISCYLVLGLTTAGMAGQIDSQIDQIQSEIEAGQVASKKILQKDARLVPVPIPIANPTLGVVSQCARTGYADANIRLGAGFSV